MTSSYIIFLSLKVLSFNIQVRLIVVKMSQENQTVATEKKTPSLLLRKGSSNKMALKEKIVQIYEAFFQVIL